MTTYTNPIRGTDNILQFANERGPRYAITSTIRRGEHYGSYRDTAEQAEAEAERQRDLGYSGVQIKAPEGFVDLAPFTRAHADAKRAERKTAKILRAAVHRRAEQMEAEGGINESALAREADVDRMTIRAWLGKR